MLFEIPRKVGQFLFVDFEIILGLNRFTHKTDGEQGQKGQFSLSHYNNISSGKVSELVWLDDETFPKPDFQTNPYLCIHGLPL